MTNTAVPLDNSWCFYFRVDDYVKGLTPSLTTPPPPIKQQLLLTGGNLESDQAYAAADGLLSRKGRVGGGRRQKDRFISLTRN